MIQLDEHDDVISAGEKISWTKASRVLLIFPRRLESQWRTLDLRRLQRRAVSLGAQLGVVARSSSLYLRCAEVGLPVFRTALEAQNTPWPRSGSSLPRRSAPRPDLRRLRDSLPRWRSDRLSFFWHVFFLSLGLLAMLSIAAIFFPSASIEVSPASSVQRLELTLLAGPQMGGESSGLIPARTLQVNVERSLTARVSGQKTVPDAAAVGRVRLENLTLRSLTIPAGTVVRTAKEPAVRFATLQDVFLPPGPGTFADVAVQALQAGTQGNLPAGALTAVEGALGADLAVTNLEPTYGGSERLAPIQTAADRQVLREQLRTLLTEDCRLALQSSAPPGAHLVIETMRIVGTPHEVFFPAEHQTGEWLALVMRLTCEAQYVVESDWLAFARNALEAALPAGFAPLRDSLRCELVQDFQVQADGLLRALLACKRSLHGQPDRLEMSFKVLGKTPDQAAAILAKSFPLAGTPQIVLTPVWWNYLPLLPARIHFSFRMP
ncbi:MAG: baseplate J/gp47 family protein [Anaerolineales bacterium]|nr:baseplate J/gp47 family protein [Anaerolineales bacterium]MDW8227544.1 baseplate J/gp47 family protein [Anaerolineales bacterium]